MPIISDDVPEGEDFARGGAAGWGCIAVVVAMALGFVTLMALGAGVR